MRTYKGIITDLPDNAIFCFGSNPVGINGNPIKGTGGAALFALNKGWVNQGEKMNNCLSSSGRAWGITTVAYPGKKRSKSPNEIIANIQLLYSFAESNKDKDFYIAYTNSSSKPNLNGYTNEELASFFKQAANTPIIPVNIIFEESFLHLLQQQTL